MNENRHTQGQSEFKMCPKINVNSLVMVFISSQYGDSSSSMGQPPRHNAIIPLTDVLKAKSIFHQCLAIILLACRSLESVLNVF